MPGASSSFENITSHIFIPTNSSPPPLFPRTRVSPAPAGTSRARPRRRRSWRRAAPKRGASRRFAPPSWPHLRPTVSRSSATRATRASPPSARGATRGSRGRRASRRRYPRPFLPPPIPPPPPHPLRRPPIRPRRACPPGWPRSIQRTSPTRMRLGDCPSPALAPARACAPPPFSPASRSWRFYQSSPSDWCLRHR